MRVQTVSLDHKPMHLSEQMRVNDYRKYSVHNPPSQFYLLACLLKQWQAAQRNSLAQRTTSEALKEWTGSAISSGLIVRSWQTIGTMVVIGTGAMRLDVFMPLAVWLVAVTWFASICILGLSKRWETRSEDAVLYRFQQMAVGLLVGTLAWGLDSYLALPWHEAYRALVMQASASSETIARHVQDHHRTPAQFYEAATPLLPAYLSYFALLFGGVRWWRLSDKVRKHRFSLTAVVFALVISFFFTNFLYFPIHFAAQSLGVLPSRCSYLRSGEAFNAIQLNLFNHKCKVLPMTSATNQNRIAAGLVLAGFLLGAAGCNDQVACRSIELETAQAATADTNHFSINLAAYKEDQAADSTLESKELVPDETQSESAEQSQAKAEVEPQAFEETAKPDNESTVEGEAESAANVSNWPRPTASKRSPDGLRQKMISQ